MVPIVVVPVALVMAMGEVLVAPATEVIMAAVSRRSWAVVDFNTNAFVRDTVAAMVVATAVKAEEDSQDIEEGGRFADAAPRGWSLGGNSGVWMRHDQSGHPWW
jgi:hypothetical protein